MERLKQPRTLARPQVLKTPPIRPRGPAFLPSKETIISGYGEPPPGFVRGQTSLTEWIVYWALYKIFDESADPRQPPFFGLYPYFEYQSPEGGGYIRALGSSVVDFLVHIGGEHIAIRIQTEFFHLFTSSSKQGSDTLQRAQLETAGLRVIDVYDQDLLGDPSGAKAIVTLKYALSLIERVNPLLAGTSIRGSRMRPAI